MLKPVVVALLLFAASVSHAQVAPVQDSLDGLLAQRGLASRLGDTIHQATDRATDLIHNAMGALGVRYRRGGNSAETGFDCSGFVRTTYEQTLGLLLPRRAEEQAAATRKIDRTDLKPGDLVFFNTLRRAYSHVGIYLGDGEFIHAPRSGARVRVESMNVSYWQKRFSGARRVLSGEAPAAPSISSDSNAATSSVLARKSPAPSAVRLGGSTDQPAEAAPAAPAAAPNMGQI